MTRERKLQEAIRQAINLSPLFTASIVDVKLVPYRKKMIKGAADVGVPDIFIACPGGRCIWLEAKIEKRKPSPAQTAWHERHRAGGGIVEVVRSVGDAAEVLWRWCENNGVQDMVIWALGEGYKTTGH